MSSHSYEHLALEETLKQYFSPKIVIKEILLFEVPVSHTLTATVFLSEKSQLYVHITGESRTTLGDIKKIVHRMGLVADTYIPPHGKKDYFDVVARDHYRKIFPGRSHVGEGDLRYYRTLAPYSPALIQIAEVTQGTIYQYDTDSSSRWRPVLKHNYRRIKTI